MQTRRSFTRSLAVLPLISLPAIAEAAFSTTARDTERDIAGGSAVVWSGSTADHPEAGTVRAFIDRAVADRRIDLSHADAYYIPMYLDLRDPSFAVAPGRVWDTATGFEPGTEGLQVTITDGPVTLVCDGLMRHKGTLSVRAPHVAPEFLNANADVAKHDFDRLLSWISPREA